MSFLPADSARGINSLKSPSEESTTPFAHRVYSNQPFPNVALPLTEMILRGIGLSVVTPAMHDMHQSFRNGDAEHLEAEK